MDFSATEDRRLLAQSLQRYLADKYPIEHRNEVAYEAPYHDPARWRELCELGILYALAGEDRGGFGGSGFDVTTVFEEIGRALCPEPVLPTLLAVRLLGAAGEDPAEVLSGEVRVAVAIGEIGAPYALEEVETTAAADGEGARLTGRKSVAYGANDADKLLVAARNDTSLGVYEAAARDVELTGYGLIDGGGAADLFLEGTPATVVLAHGAAALQDALDWGALALCAEAVGAMDFAQEATLEYMKTRQQFGRPIGSFQALQHRLVDLTIEIEQARSITILAASRMGTDAQSLTVSMAKNLVGRTATLVAEEAIQLHGGIAMTWEVPISHYAKRLVMIDHQLGDTDYHLHKVMAAHRQG